jgi:hypothetical protein
MEVACKVVTKPVDGITGAGCYAVPWETALDEGSDLAVLVTEAEGNDGALVAGHQDVTYW